MRWRQSLETLAGLGATVLVELGPGGVLSGLARRVLPEVVALAVSKPDDLDRLMDVVATGDTTRGEPAVQPGEHLYMSERVVVSPSAGIFAPEQALAAPGTGLLPGTAAEAGTAGSSTVAVGDLVGRVGVQTCAPRSPARSSAGWPPRASGCRRASPWCGCGWTGGA